jgi:hypothetical protein
MSISKTVEGSLKEAETHLREALAFSSRSEESYVISSISKLIKDIDSLLKFDEIMQTFKDLPK